MVLAGDPEEWAKLGIKPGEAMSESDIQKAVIQHLKERSVPNSVWFHVPNNRSSRRHSGFNAGVSDLILLHQSEAFALELKTKTGGVVSDAQSRFISRWNDAGGFGFVAKGYDEAVAALKGWGLIR